MTRPERIDVDELREEHAALVAAVRAAEAMCKRMRNCQDALAARRACDEALASELVQRAIARGT